MVKTLLKNVKEYTAAAVATPLFMLVEVAMEMVIPLLMASMIDKGVEVGNFNHILKIGGVMVIAALIGLWGGLMGAKYSAKASTGFAKNLREAMFKNVQTFSAENIDKYSTAGLITRLTTDVTNIQNSFQMLIRMGMRAPASLVIAMIMSFSISKTLAMTYVYAIGFIMVVVVILLFLTKKLFEILFEKYDGINASTRENVSAIRVVKAYVREAYEKSKFHEANQALYNASIKAEKIMAGTMPIMSAVIYGCILSISWLGAKNIVYGELTTGQLMSMLSYCMNILINLLMLSVIIVMLTMSLANMKRVAEVLNEKATIVNPENPVMEMKDGSVSFENVFFSYKNQSGEPVLKNINLNIKSGETIGVMGSTGSSKTSLVNLISRLYDVTDGSVKVGGVDVRDYDLDVLRNNVSVVLQNNVLFSGSILENLRWGNENATDEECIRACKLACADEFIDRLPDKYNTHIERGGTNVSGGQRQRLCIARALMKQPKVLILDDSTSAVDTATDANIRRAFREEIPGVTKFIIAQRVTSVMDADRIIVMDDGTINGIGTHEELLANNEIYKDVYETQTGQGAGDFDSEKRDD